MPDVLEVDSSCDLLYHNWSQSLFPQLLVNTQEVNFSHLYGVLVYDSFAWGSTDKSEDFVGLSSCSDGNMPLLVKSRLSEVPSKEINWIIKSEYTIVVLNVMFSEKRVDKLGFIIIRHINCYPLKALW